MTYVRRTGPYLRRAEKLEADLLAIGQEAKTAVTRVVAHSVLVEAALAVLMKHDLLNEFSGEVARLEGLRDEKKRSAEPDQSLPSVPGRGERS
jgi:hypothetical protein